jgi:hypothetical protein
VKSYGHSTAMSRRCAARPFIASRSACKTAAAGASIASIASIVRAHASRVPRRYGCDASRLPPWCRSPGPALAGVEGVAIEDSAAAFARRLEQELAGDGPERRRARRAVADGHSWEAQLERVRAAL